MLTGGLLILSLSVPAIAQLAVEGVTETDVTPSGFTILWQASEVSEPLIRIYADAAGQTEITTSFEIIPLPLKTGSPDLAEEYSQDMYKEDFLNLTRSLGLIAMRVEGVHPATTYYYRIFSIGRTETAFWPTESMAAVTTPVKNSFLANANQLVVTIDHPAPEGWLITATNPAASYGVSAFVGDGADSKTAILNLADMFGADGMNWEPSGPEDVVITVLSGWETPFQKTFTLDFSSTFAVATVHNLRLSMGGIEIGYSPTSFSFTANLGGPNPPSQILSLSNALVGAINWSVDDDATWLSLNPGSGADSGSVTVSVDTAGLAVGTYNAIITITAADAVNSPVTIPVTLKETVLGDLNGDGLVDLQDDLVALKVLSGKSPLNPNEPYVIREDYVTSGVDMSGNNRIGLEELLYILQKTGGFR